MSHPLGQVFRCERLLHNPVVPRENTVEVWDHHDESHSQTGGGGRQREQDPEQPSADGDHSSVVEEGCCEQDDGHCLVR